MSSELINNFSDIVQHADYVSPVRRGRVEMLPIGAWSVIDIDRPTLVSTADGAIKVESGRYGIYMFEIVKHYRVSNLEMRGAKFHVFDRIKNDFARAEADIIYNKLYNTDSLVQCETKEEVPRLRKMFKDLGKDVVVLPSAEVIDLASQNFTLWIRNNLEVQHRNSLVSNHVELTLWETVGFTYEL